MDYKKYSIALEDIIKDMDLPDHTRILVDRLVNLAKRDAAKAEQIKAAFEAKAIQNGSNLNFTKEDRLFYSCDGKVNYCSNSGGLANIIKTHPDYKELELPVEPKFKVGDWVVFNNNHNSIYQISKIKDSFYILIHIYDGSMPLSFSQEGLIRPWTIEDAKDGDVLVTTKIRSCPFIYRKPDFNNDLAYYYAGIDGNGNFCEDCLKRTLYHFGPVANVAPATKEQRDLLFAKMKEAGYEWDADNKELRKIKPHYDIANFKPFDKVLVRDADDRKWRCNWFSHYSGDGGVYRFETTKCGYAQCIPYEGNEHLFGTTDMCDEMYINW